jgi:tetratricopeptide (TPR) repeat protein
MKDEGGRDSGVWEGVTAGRRMLLQGLALVGLVICVAGCGKMFEQKGEEALSMAQEKEKEGDYPAAVRWYEASLDGTGRTAEAHYALALIYDDKVDDPVEALAHYRRYLELAPDGAHVADAKSFASQDEFKLVNTLSKGNFMPQQDAAWLKNQNYALQKQLADARKEVTDMRAEARGMPAVSGAATPALPPGARLYRVEPGDTLRSISRKNSPNRWEDIEDANYHMLGSGQKLKVGMTLVIPKG